MIFWIGHCILSFIIAVLFLSGGFNPYAWTRVEYIVFDENMEMWFEMRLVLGFASSLLGAAGMFFWSGTTCFILLQTFYMTKLKDQQQQQEQQEQNNNDMASNNNIMNVATGTDVENRGVRNEIPAAAATRPIAQSTIPLRPPLPPLLPQQEAVHLIRYQMSASYSDAEDRVRSHAIALRKAEQERNHKKSFRIWCLANVCMVFLPVLCWTIGFLVFVLPGVYRPFEFVTVTFLPRLFFDVFVLVVCPVLHLFVLFLKS